MYVITVIIPVMLLLNILLSVQMSIFRQCFDTADLASGRTYGLKNTAPTTSVSLETIGLINVTNKCAYAS